MIHFNELYITEDGQHLIIDVEVDAYTVYDGTLISCIKVDLAENFTDGDISRNAVVVWDKDDDYVYVGTDDVLEHIYPRTNPLKETHVRLCLTSSDIKKLGKQLNLLEHLFVVKVEADYTASASQLAEMNCDWENNTITGIAYNGYPIYKSIVRLSDNYGDNCDDISQREFIDYIMRYYGFVFALRTGDITQAVQYWNNYLTDTSKIVSISRKCGCHGTY